MTAGTEPSKALNITLWVVQFTLAFAFGTAGFTKLTQPLANLAQMMPWTTAVPSEMVRFIGAAELAGALGLLLPALSRIKPLLTALAGAGLLVVMVLAAGFHLTRAEYGALPINLVLGGLAAFVAWGRYKKAPISPRA